MMREVWGTFLPYQRRYILDPSRLILVEKSVRTGFTYGHSFKMARRFTFLPPSRHSREIFASKTERVAKEYVGYMKRWADVFNTIFGSKVVDTGSWTQDTLRFPTGEVLIVSSNEDAFRGLAGSVTLDEFAFHNRQRELYATAQGRIMWDDTNQLHIFSSHFHPQTMFARLAKEAAMGQNDFKHYRVTLPDAVKEGLAFKVPGPHHSLYDKSDPKSILAVNARFIDDIRRRSGDPETFAREYLCEAAGGANLVKPDEYDRVVLKFPGGEPKPVPEAIPAEISGELFIGIDIGRSKNLTVIWVLERGYDTNPNTPDQFRSVYRTVAVRSLHNTPFPIQQAVIQEFVNHPLASRVVIDQGGIGLSLAQSLREEFGSMVEPFQITAPRKAQLCEALRVMVQQERVSLHPDPRVREDILCMRREPTENGNLKYDGHSSGGSHADYFMALSMAIRAAEGETRLGLTSDEDRDGYATPAQPLAA